MVADKLGVAIGRSIVADAQRSKKSWLLPTVMDGPALSVIDALPGRNAIRKAPRAAGYRGSDFVLWHLCPVHGDAAFPSAIGGRADKE